MKSIDDAVREILKQRSVRERSAQEEQERLDRLRTRILKGHSSSDPLTTFGLACGVGVGRNLDPLRAIQRGIGKGRTLVMFAIDEVTVQKVKGSVGYSLARSLHIGYARAPLLIDIQQQQLVVPMDSYVSKDEDSALDSWVINPHPFVLTSDDLVHLVGLHQKHPVEEDAYGVQTYTGKEVREYFCINPLVDGLAGHDIFMDNDAREQVRCFDDVHPSFVIALSLLGRPIPHVDRAQFAEKMRPHHESILGILTNHPTPSQAREALKQARYLGLQAVPQKYSYGSRTIDVPELLTSLREKYDR